jgi:hypothetical protein
MDQFFPDGAVATPPAAEPVGQPSTEGQVAGDQVATQATAPDATAPPQLPADTTDYKALWESNAPKINQYEQAFGELRQLMAAAQQEQSERQLRTESQQRIDRVYQVAETMPPEDALRYIRQSEDQERASLHGAINQVRQQGQTQAWQMAAAVAAPLYADDLAQQAGLPREYAQRLRAVGDPRQMDAMLPHLRAEHAQRQEMDRKYQTLVQQFDQLQRSTQAGGLAATGAHTGGGTGVPTGTNGAAAVHDGSTQDLLSIPGMAEMFGLR